MPPKSKVSDRFPKADVFFGTSADLPRIVEIDLAKITPNPDQPRRAFDPEKLRELADSIAENGLIHPITVRRADRETFMIVAGERRFRAYGLLERSSIPAIISEGGVDELALIENIQREDLSPIDEFRAVARLIESHGYNQADAARVLGKSRVSINELMSLTALAPAILDEAQALGTSKSTLIEIARSGDEVAQLNLWAGLRGGAKTVRALRTARKSPGAGKQESSPIGAALRAGRRFVSALKTLPNAARSKPLSELANRMVDLLAEYESSSTS